MSGHTLPPDPSSWPDNPFELLGVAHGVSPRELRKAYLHLVRQYKPDHAPEEFRRVREAFESVERLSKLFQWGISPVTDENQDANEPAPVRPVVRDQPACPPPPDLWELACQGDVEGAYQGLKERLARGPLSEEVFLQLYWLLVVCPTLDPDREPVDWLYKGLNSCGARAVRLRERLRGEVAADPHLAIEGLYCRPDLWFTRAAPDVANGGSLKPDDEELLVDLMIGRWRAARSIDRYDRILADLGDIRTSNAPIGPDARARLLVTAAEILVWSGSQERAAVTTLRKEIDSLSHLTHDVSEELFRIEYAESIAQGLDQLGPSHEFVVELRNLLRISWDEYGLEFRFRLSNYTEKLARRVSQSLQFFDVVAQTAPTVLGRLIEIMGHSHDGFPKGLKPASSEADQDAFRRFIGSESWWQYQRFRPALLAFCVREFLSPLTVLPVLAGRPKVTFLDSVNLGNAVASDWPLLHVYQAYALFHDED